MSAHTRRMENERRALALLLASNPERASLRGEFEIELLDAPYYSLADGEARRGLRVRFEFPEYYPAVPVEAFLSPPVLHPNVHPESGFVCLWESHHAGTALVEAVLQTMRVVSWRLLNRRAEHVMQDVEDRPALPYRPLEVPASFYLERSAGELPGPRRRRLS